MNEQKNKLNTQQVNALLRHAGAKFGIPPEKLAAAAKQGNLSSLAASLTPSQAEAVSSILSDKKKAEQLLNTPEAQEILRRLLEKQEQ